MSAPSTASDDHDRRSDRGFRGARTLAAGTSRPHHDRLAPCRPIRAAVLSPPALADSEPERVLATALITDIVNSTEHLVRVGDRAWQQLLARHDTLIHSELDRHNGRALNHMGDGVLAAFARPSPSPC